MAKLATYPLCSIEGATLSTALAHARLLSELAPDGFNLGVNVGRVAGQTIFHAHLHLIPRCQGDIENRRGGVRGVIPAMQQY